MEVTFTAAGQILIILEDKNDFFGVEDVSAELLVVSWLKTKM